jgi:hypothetical protein
MPNKLGLLKIIAALGIPLFPLGAFFLPPNRAPGFREPGEAPRDIPAPAFEPETPAEAEPPPGEEAPPVAAETLALAFRAPNRVLNTAPNKVPNTAAAGAGQAGTRPPGDITPAQPVPGEGKFSYLGSIRESNDREWLYIKEEASGRIISFDASLGSTNEESCVVEIEGASYFIRRR